MPIGDLLQVRMVCVCGEQTALNIRHYVITAIAGVERTRLQIVQDMDNAYAPLYKALMSNEAQYRGMDIKRLAPGVPTVSDATAANNGAGTLVSDVLPRQVCGVIGLKTALAGRKYRGRVYVPFPSESVSSVLGTPTAGHVTALGNLSAQLTAAFNSTQGLNTTTLAPVLLHKGSPPSWDNLTTGIVRGRFGTQRRRGSYGQPNPVPF